MGTMKAFYHFKRFQTPQMPFGEVNHIWEYLKSLALDLKNICMVKY